MMNLQCPICNGDGFYVCEFCSISSVEGCDCCGGTGLGATCEFCMSDQVNALQAEHTAVLKHFEEQRNLLETMADDFSVGSNGRVIQQIRLVKLSKDEVYRVETRLLDEWFKAINQAHFIRETVDTTR